MAFFNLHHWRMRQIRRENGLCGKKLLGRGLFAAVYDGGDTVLKLTACEKSYYLNRDYWAPKGVHFPTLVNDFGMVGEYRDTGIYLVEIEKLVKFPRGAVERRLIKKIVDCTESATENHYVKNGWKRMHDARVDALWTVAQEDWLPESMREALEGIQTFCFDYGDCVPDFHPGNFMMRPGTGDIVFSDPVATNSMIMRI